ncbi:hypothetical protein QE364_004033 [Nocardioides zeae]|uniref:Uncharacterized protein n=1 Tax=Nocardioides zeae TaxID=1457234 RepID=A0ACC6INF7_9ACTN|nr:hypothetical protein [Nocardioides zeae]MDR6175114.1 hypothetical protein [Nocardioides zeae]MDR6212297.1 hypothetical protein [Nocardioides zeae]
MDIDDAALHAWAPGLAPAVAGLPADRRTWRINRSGVRGLLAASSAGLTWSEQGGLVTRPFTDVASLELVGVNGVVLHVHGLLPARLTFPDVRDRDAFAQVLHAQRAAGHGPAPAAPVAPTVLTVPIEQLPPLTVVPVAPGQALPVPPVAVPPVAAAPVAAPAAPVAARGRSGPSPFGPPTARSAAPQVPPVPPAFEVPVAPAWPTSSSYPAHPTYPTYPAYSGPALPPAPQAAAPHAPQARPSSHPPSSSRLRAARLAEERRAGMVPGPTAAPEAPQHAQHPQHPRSPTAAAPSGDLAVTRLRDGLLVAGFLAGVGVLLAFFSSQAASQSVQSTGSHVLTYVGIGLVVLGVATALVTAGRALGGSQR